METTKENPQQDKLEKPDWLKALERQSWEAELIVSGLAIYGAIYLLPCVDVIIETIARSFSDRVMISMNPLMMYLIITSRIILLSFIFHFVLRILWIGVVGLTSVYPDGINIENKSFTRSYLSKYKEDFPTLTHYSISLDKFCSQIFAILCLIIMIMIVIFMWIGVWVILVELLSKVFAPKLIAMSAWALVIIFYGALIAMVLMTSGRLKDKPIGEKYGYPLAKYLNKAFSLFFYKPSMLLSMTLRTNSTTKNFLISNVVIMLIAFGSSLNSLHRMDEITDKRDFHRMNSQANSANYQNYEDEMHEGTILRPMIQSSFIKEDYLSLYLPLYKREQLYKDSVCGSFIKTDSLRSRDNEILRNEFDLSCLQKYYKLSIDDMLIKDPKFILKRHHFDSREGHLCIIDLDSIDKGDHVLKIQTQYKNDKGELAVRFIPFYKQ